MGRWTRLMDRKEARRPRRKQPHFYDIKFYPPQVGSVGKVGKNGWGKPANYRSATGTQPNESMRDLWFAGPLATQVFNLLHTGYVQEIK